jgi:hypothetical protein
MTRTPEIVARECVNAWMALRGIMLERVRTGGRPELIGDEAALVERLLREGFDELGDPAHYFIALSCEMFGAGFLRSESDLAEFVIDLKCIGLDPGVDLNPALLH